MAPIGRMTAESLAQPTATASSGGLSLPPHLRRHVRNPSGQIVLEDLPPPTASVDLNRSDDVSTGPSSPPQVLSVAAPTSATSTALSDTPPVPRLAVTSVNSDATRVKDSSPMVQYPLRSLSCSSLWSKVFFFFFKW